MTVVSGSPLLTRLEREVLPLVSKPNRYVGNERGIVRKDWDSVRVRMLLCFPDVYDVGMSHLGTQILYHLVNRSADRLLERAYAPWPDMERLMRERGIPLYALESGREAREFDVVGFTLQSELTYTNVLTMLDLARIPLRQADRRDGDPVVLTGGPCASNPEPLAPFVDATLVGDGEEAIREILDLVADHKEAGGRPGEGASARERLLWRLATEVRGVYVPHLYGTGSDHRTIGQSDDRTIGQSDHRTIGPSDRRTGEPADRGPAHPRTGEPSTGLATPGTPVPRCAGTRSAGTPVPSDGRLPFPVVARVVPSLREEDYPTEMLVPVGEVVHDRLSVEIQRGCVRGCRFCQAGYLYRPARERGVEECVRIAERGIAHSGHEEASLLSLSTADYSEVERLVDEMARSMERRGVSVSLPSLRADGFSVALAEAVSRVRKAGFTFAPEAGSERLRRVINKGLREEEILGAVDRAMAAGWQGVKLYFMVGLPTETDQDVEELAALARRIVAVMRRHRGRRRLSLAVSPFVPKAHTPFQWERQSPAEEVAPKLRRIRDLLRGRDVEVKHHGAAETAIEGMISRGGRETADVIEGAWRRGARFDGWSETLDYGAWRAALETLGWTIEECLRERGENEDLPWEVVSYRFPRQWLLEERRKAMAGEETDDCKVGGCSACGVCDFEVVRNVLANDRTVGQSDDRTVGQSDDRGVRRSDGPMVRRSAGPPVLRSAGSLVRLRYAKRAPLRFVGHLELMRELDRTLRRAGVPVLYSGGFSARPLVSAGPPLATGWLSESEWADVEMAGGWDAPALEELLIELNRHAAAGMAFLAAGVLSGKGQSLMASVERSTYRATFPQPPFEWSLADLGERCRTFLARADAPYARERHGRTTEMDLRPLVLDLAALDAATVAVEVRTASDGSAKPTEVLEAALRIPRERVPLVIIQKTATRLAGGAKPLGACPVAVGETEVEARDSDQRQPAGDARGHPGGRPAC